MISRAVRDHVRDRLALSFEDMGERRGQDIARPVRAFRVRAHDGANGRRTLPAGGVWPRRAAPLLAAGGVADRPGIAGVGAWLAHSGPAAGAAGRV